MTVTKLKDISKGVTVMVKLMDIAGINIIFEGGQAMDGIHGCVYMLGRYVDDDGDEQELYAEVLAPDTEEECDDDDFGYDELKAEIIKQAKEIGISEDRLIFPGKNFV